MTRPAVSGRWDDVRQHGWVVLAVVGLVLVVGGSALHIAMSYPPYGLDETSHVGYSLSLEDGRLPSIDTPVSRGHDDMLDTALSRPAPWYSADVYTANNPPYVYLAAIPFVEGSERAGASPLFGFRLFSVIAAALAVGCAFLLGRELAGGDWFAGLVTAGLLASVTSISMVAAWASIDSPALFVTTGTTWALARYARLRSNPAAWWLGGWCALAAAVRPMALVFALVAGAVALALGGLARGARALPGLVLRLAAPTVVFAGWFYVLNFHRYGNLTGSDALFDKFAMEPHGTLLHALGDAHNSVNPFAFLVRELYADWLFYDPGIWGPLIAGLTIAILAGALGLACLSARSERRGASGVGANDEARSEPAPGDPFARHTLSPSAWLAVICLCPVPFVLLAQHYARGGGPHPRFLLPVLPIVAAALALLLTRLDRWVAVSFVAVVLLVHLSRVAEAGDSAFPNRPVFGLVLSQSLIGDGPQAVALGIAVVGVGVFLVAAVYSARRQRDHPQASSVG